MPVGSPYDLCPGRSTRCPLALPAPASPDVLHKLSPRSAKLSIDVSLWARRGRAESQLRATRVSPEPRQGPCWDGVSRPTARGVRQRRPVYQGRWGIRLLAWLIDFVVIVLGVGVGTVVLSVVAVTTGLPNGIIAVLALLLLFVAPVLYGLCYGNGRALGALLTDTARTSQGRQSSRRPRRAGPCWFERCSCRCCSWWW